MALTSPSTATKVLHVINGSHYSGAERVQDHLARCLSELGFTVGFVCLKPGRFAAARQAKESPLVISEMRSRFDLRPAWTISRLVQHEGYRIVHTHTPRSALVGRAAGALTRVPRVHHLHSPTDEDSTNTGRNRFNAWVERQSVRGAAAVIPVSYSLARYAARLGVPLERTHVIPNGVPSLGALLSRPTPNGTWVLGIAGLFRPRKGLEVLLDALRILNSESSCVRLRAIGEFETEAYRSHIMRRAEILGVSKLIDWVGFSNDVSGEMSSMDLFVLPSLFGEGLPMVVLEAMAAGVPIVASRVEGVPEVIRDGVDGLLVEPADASSLANAIGQFIRGRIDWLNVRANAHRRQAERFSDGSMALSVAALYRRVLE